MSVNKEVYQFRIELQDIAPPIWRQIQVPADYSFWDLHVAIQDAMGWLDYHLHAFHIQQSGSMKRIAIGVPDSNFNKSTLAGWETSIKTYFVEPGFTADYIYDFGDDWRHTVQLEAILDKDPAVKYPVCIAGERACPPEECGGIPGYEGMLELLSDPHHELYEDQVNWLKEHRKNYFPYKPDHFALSKVKFKNPKKHWKARFGSPD